ncbi:nitrite reductase [Ferroplasma sp.]|uniref:nitrite reductase n=1 Tax=Ferroplasma sp. TaxID=2591003 RepID=UPI00307FC509
MKKDVNEYLNNIINSAPSEEMYFEAMHDVFKDLIKEYIRKKINEDDDLKKQISEVLEEFMEAKIKEYDSLAKMAKVTAKIGIISAPNGIKNEALNDFMETFKKEIEEVIKSTL